MTALSDKRAGDAFSAAFGGQRGRLDADKLSARHPTVHARALLADKLAGGAVRDDLIAELYQHRYQREGLPLIAELFEQTVSSLARSCRTTFHKRAEALLAASGLRDEYSRTAYELPLTTRMLYRRATGEFEQNPALTHVWEQGDRSHLPGFGRTVQFACGLEGAIDPTCRVRRDIVAARARAWKTDPSSGHVCPACAPALLTMRPLDMSLWPKPHREAMAALAKRRIAEAFERQLHSWRRAPDASDVVGYAQSAYRKALCEYAGRWARQESERVLGEFCDRPRDYLQLVSPEDFAALYAKVLWAPEGTKPSKQALRQTYRGVLVEEFWALIDRKQRETAG